MNSDGKKIIESLCERLKFEGKMCTDSQITSLLRSLDRYEVNELITFRTLAKWEREKNKK